MAEKVDGSGVPAATFSILILAISVCAGRRVSKPSIVWARQHSSRNGGRPARETGTPASGRPIALCITVFSCRREALSAATAFVARAIPTGGTGQAKNRLTTARHGSTVTTRSQRLLSAGESLSRSEAIMRRRSPVSSWASRLSFLSIATDKAPMAILTLITHAAHREVG